MDLDPSPSLSLIRKAKPTLEGRCVAVMVADGSDPALIEALRGALAKEGARLEVVGPKIGGAAGKGGKTIAIDHTISGGPSVLFDAVVVALAEEGAAALADEAAAVNWVRDAFGHLKVIGATDGADVLLQRGAIEADDGVITIASGKDLGAFISAAKRGRVWDREPDLRKGA